MCVWKTCVYEKIHICEYLPLCLRERKLPIMSKFPRSIPYVPMTLCSYVNNAILNTMFLFALCLHSPTSPPLFTHVNTYFSQDCLVLHHFELSINETILYLSNLAFFSQFYWCDICGYMSSIFTSIYSIYEYTKICICILL